VLKIITYNLYNVNNCRIGLPRGARVITVTKREGFDPVLSVLADPDQPKVPYYVECCRRNNWVTQELVDVPFIGSAIEDGHPIYVFGGTPVNK